MSDKKGIGLIIVISFIAILILTVAAVLSQSLKNRRLTTNVANSTRAFYAAESGLNKAAAAVSAYESDYRTWASSADYPNWLSAGWSVDITSSPYVLSLGSQPLVSSDGDTVAYYQIHIEVDVTDPDIDIVRVYADGYAPTASGAQRSIKAVLRKVITPHPTQITGAIETLGSLSVGGGATVNGDATGDSDFVFEDIFGATKEEVKALANVIVDPITNYAPVQDITWFDLDVEESVQIASSLWEGSGIMIVDGDLKITGGIFTGIIWVTGNADLDVAGNAVIEGAIFVEGSASIIGTATISFDSEGVSETLGEAFPQDPIASWEESTAIWEEM